MLIERTTENRPRIVVLDGQTLNPGDNPWNPLAALGELAVYDYTEPAELIERARDATVLVTNKVPLTAAAIGALPALRLITVAATGYNIVDVPAARQRGVVVCNVPDYATTNVAQYTFALILELCHRVADHSASVLQGEWQRRGVWSYCLSPQMELAGNALGIVGFGRIGQRVAQIARAFGMDVLATRSSTFPADVEGVRWATHTQIYEQADVITLHCPQTAGNRQMINDAALRQMKHSALLINVSRGTLIDEAALASCLQRRGIAGAAVDVLSTEPPAGDNPLLQAPHCIITPHIAWAAREARVRMMELTAQNIAAFFKGQPRNVVE